MRLLLFLSSFLAISAHALPSHEDLLYPSSNLEDSLLSPRPHLAPVADFIYLVRRELFSEDHALQPLTLIPRAPKGGGSGSGGGGGAKGSGEEAGGGGGGKGKGGKGKGHSKDHGKDSKDDARLKEKKDMKQCTSLSDQTKKKMKNCLKVRALWCYSRLFSLRLTL